MILTVLLTVSSKQAQMKKTPSYSFFGNEENQSYDTLFDNVNNANIYESNNDLNTLVDQLSSLEDLLQSTKQQIISSNL